MTPHPEPVSFETHPDRYRHWRLQVEGEVATLVLDIAEDGGLREGYALKLNSYDRPSTVSLPEVPLLGVVPGTGGLTRPTDKRRVRHDHADIFCTTSEGIRGQRAKDWHLVDEVVRPQGFAQRVQERARELAA